jgi:hypothetical protein
MIYPVDALKAYVRMLMHGLEHFGDLLRDGRRLVGDTSAPPVLGPLRT